VRPYLGDAFAGEGARATKYIGPSVALASQARIALPQDDI